MGAERDFLMEGVRNANAGEAPASKVLGIGDKHSVAELHSMINLRRAKARTAVYFGIEKYGLSQNGYGIK